MAEQKLVLEWLAHDTAPRNPSWTAKAGPLRLTVTHRRGYSRPAWDVEGYDDCRDGSEESVEGAQLAAEAAALAWLREGVEALGGRVLTAEQVAMVVEAIRALFSTRPLPFECMHQQGDDLERLARELEGGGT